MHGSTSSASATFARCPRSAPLLLYLVVALGGFAGLGWELIWQVKASLAIGVSSQSTAVVLAATMGGMALGTIASGTFLQRYRQRINPFFVYALLESFIAIFGFFIQNQFRVVALIDRATYQSFPAYATLIHLLSIASVIGPPAAAMGASIPVFGLLAKRVAVNISLLYAVNVLGAAIGVLLIAFLVLPITGISRAATMLACVNAVVASFSLFLGWYSPKYSDHSDDPVTSTDNMRGGWILAFISGFSILALEVIFFRAMKAAFLSTSYSFAIMLSSVLLALAVGSYASTIVKRCRESLSSILALAGALLFLLAPIVERLDAFTSYLVIGSYLSKFLISLAVTGPVVFALGIIFPYLLERGTSPKIWGALHAINTFGAIVGALSAAWIFLPTFGIAKTIWIIATIVFCCAILGNHDLKVRLLTIGAGVLVALIAFLGQANVGRTRIISSLRMAEKYSVLGFRETPDFTISVISDGQTRSLFIDGFSASAGFGTAGYMTWMGRLPMLVHKDPKKALIICFGRGETANALLQENPASIDIVDISQAVFEMSQLFPENQNVLLDSRVNPIVMDGRAWLSRTESNYDVITLEPMPPAFAGVNNLYSREFYQAAGQRLRDGGVIAQWLPFHLLTPAQAEAISQTFIATFPKAFLWINESEPTGILIGRKGEESLTEWPGLERPIAGRELSPEQIKNSVQLAGFNLSHYANSGVSITDDNQYLSYGWDSQKLDYSSSSGTENVTESLNRIKIHQRGDQNR